MDRATPGTSGAGGDGGTRIPRFINRELSWLDFSDRLLDLADDPGTPLLERAKFLALFAEGLDEFFQVRVAGLEDQVAAGLRTRSPDGMQPAEQLQAVSNRVRVLVDRQATVFREGVAPALEAAGVVLASDWSSLDAEDLARLDEVYQERIFPVLTPLAVDPGHPFPYISNLSLNLVVEVEDPVTGERRIARVKVPPVLPRFVVLRGGSLLVPLEQVIAARLDTLFPSMTIAGHHVFRVTRNADLSLEEDDAGDLLAAVELELRRRRFGQAVRLEVAAGIDPALGAMLEREIGVGPDAVYTVDAPVDLSGLWVVHGLDRPDLAADPWVPRSGPYRSQAGPTTSAGSTASTAPSGSSGSSGPAGPTEPPGAGQSPTPAEVFAVLAERDVLVHHPYDSFAASVETFIAAAADDPDVLAIKQTLYRTSGESAIVESLIRASQAGKQVVALVELQARFDEQANIAWARALEEAGVHVVHGHPGLKTHAKMALVVRREGDRSRRYCHIGTGNYNARTARAYEDVGLLTADPAITGDVGALFNDLTRVGPPGGLGRLVVAPTGLRSRILALIDEEAAAGPAGRIVVKANGVTDPEVIDGLYRASAAGAAIDLVVTSRCCVRAGVPGLSETIRVRSIVGRFLEHSRIYRFGDGRGRPVRVLLGSADLMERSLDRRIEVLVPVDSPDLRERLVGILDAALRDEANSWVLGPDDRWTRVGAAAAGADPPFSVQRHHRGPDRTRVPPDGPTAPAGEPPVPGDAPGRRAGRHRDRSLPRWTRWARRRLWSRWRS